MDDRAKAKIVRLPYGEKHLVSEAKDVGLVLASIAREIENKKRPSVSVAGGETTVSISGEHGEGGRNQELAMAAALKIGGSKKITIASIGTDGSDGPTDIAGAIVDGYIVDSAARAGIDLFACFKVHDTSNAFRRLQDAIYTGDTGTNLMDLMIVYVS
jgi:glycerate-2-kinase